MSISRVASVQKDLQVVNPPSYNAATGKNATGKNATGKNATGKNATGNSFLAPPSPSPSHSPSNRNLSRTNQRLSIKRKLTHSNRSRVVHVNSRKQEISKSLINTETCFLIESITELKPISSVSGSGSTVSSFKYNTKTYIIKHATVDNENEITITNLTNECQIYKNIINMLIDNYVTPYCIRCYEYRICTNGENTNFAIINETNNDTTRQLLNIEDFINKCIHLLNLETFYNLLFQITYTLKCFNYINLKHYDLHAGNILVFYKTPEHDKEFNSNGEKIYFKYGESQEDELYLDNIGIDLRIFDFDHSIKNKQQKPSTNTNWNKDFYNTEYFPSQPNTPGHPYLDRSKNDFVDIFKILCTIFNIILKNYNLIAQTIFTNLFNSKAQDNAPFKLITDMSEEEIIKFRKAFADSKYYLYLSQVIYILFKLLKIKDEPWKTISIDNFPDNFFMLYIADFEPLNFKTKSLEEYNLLVEILQHYKFLLSGQYHIYNKDKSGKYTFGGCKFLSMSFILMNTEKHAEILQATIRTPDEYVKDILAPFLSKKPVNDYSVIGAYNFNNLITGNTKEESDRTGIVNSVIP